MERSMQKKKTFIDSGI